MADETTNQDYQRFVQLVRAQHPDWTGAQVAIRASELYRIELAKQGKDIGYSEATVSTADPSRPSVQEQTTGSPPPERLPMDSQYDDSTGIGSMNWERAEQQRNIPQTVSKTDESRPSTRDLGRPFTADDPIERLYGPAAANWVQEDRRDRTASQRQDEEIANFQKAQEARRAFADAEAGVQSTRDFAAANEKQRVDAFAAEEAARAAYVKKFFDPNGSFDESLNTVDSEKEDPSKPKNPKAKRQVAGDYTPQYYSGAQTQIYFNDVLIDEITNIQYTPVTNKAPIYGYASELFDTVAAGNFIIQGSFTINFVEAGYLQIIAMAMLERKFGVNAIGRMTDTRWVNSRKRSAPDMRAETSTKATSILDPNSYLAKQALNQVAGLGNKEFRQIARDAVFNKITKEGNYSGSSAIKTINGIRVPSRFDLIPPFDIYGIFGDFTNPKVDHTVRRLKDVYLTGMSQSVSPSGEPIFENYSFIARDLE